MSFKFKRFCRWRLCLLYIPLLFILYLIFNNLFIYSPSNLRFVELNSCPACFGVRLCHLFGTNAVQLTGWQRFSIFNSDLFNVKNIYYGTMNNKRVVFKKMAHQSEWVLFDDCQQSPSCFHSTTSSLGTLLPCSNDTFVSKFKNAFLQSTDLDRHDSQISFATTVQMNLEPIVLSGLTEIDFPFPVYYGACGRVGVVSDEGSNFVSYLDSPFHFRAYLVRELLISMHQLTVSNAEIILYYPDVNLENFVYNKNERRVKIIDLEYLIIVERDLFRNEVDAQDVRNHANKFCNTYMPDYNIEQICRYILSPSLDMKGKEMSSDFLHHIPPHIDKQLNLSQTILTCAQTESKEERMAISQMSKDRLKDLRQATSWPHVAYEGLTRQFSNHHEQTSEHSIKRQGTKISIDKESGISQFLNEAEVIRKIIERIDGLTQQVKQMHVDMLQPTASSKLGQELDDKNEEIKNLSYDIAAKLKKLEQSQTHQTDYDITSAQWRIRESQIFALTRQFRDTMIEYNKEAVLYRERCKKIIARELEISGNRRNYDELDAMLDTGYPGTFSFPIMVQTQKAQQSLDEIEARHRDIMKLEKSIKELHNMFLDLAILVNDQGEMVDCIEHNISKAVDYVQDAAENVYITEQYQKADPCDNLIVYYIFCGVFYTYWLFHSEKNTNWINLL
ncbi:unnamed protein product [Adineta ricciae]|uniref:t-SNARE coiled-coil homology domain-containing protein n=1 Tax=Adineta ricciae TaxID=249248 RepID=A0A815N3D1_ADIRI|nr:unnamed protein product [Adineta ricciae]